MMAKIPENPESDNSKPDEPIFQRALKTHIKLISRSFFTFFDESAVAGAGHMAFLGMLSFFPFLIFLVALSGFLGQTDAGASAITLLMENLPEEVRTTLERPINRIVNNTRGDVLTFSILFAIWTAASGIEAARGAIVRAYGKKYRKAIWKSRLESLAIVIVAAILIIIAMAVQVLGPALLKWVQDIFILPDTILNLIGLIRYLITPFMLFLAIYALYYVLSPRQTFKKHIRAPGALASLVVWMVTAVGFSTFLKYVGNYDVTYGALAGVMIAQIFFFVVSIGFIFGAHLNATYDHYIKDLHAIDRRK